MLFRKACRHREVNDLKTAWTMTTLFQERKLWAQGIISRNRTTLSPTSSEGASARRACETRTGDRALPFTSNRWRTERRPISIHPETLCSQVRSLAFSARSQTESRHASLPTDSDCIARWSMTSCCSVAQALGIISRPPSWTSRPWLYSHQTYVLKILTISR